MRNLLVDLNNIAFVTRFGALRNVRGKEYVTELITKETISNILNHAKTLKTDAIVIAVDSKNPWRKDFYPMYKEGRDTKADKYYDNTKEAIGKVAEFFRDYTSAMVIQVPRVEADDIIAVWSRMSDNETVILSTDKDFVQLLDKKTALYSPPNKDFRTSEDPQFDLFVKCIRGDNSDAIRSAYPRVQIKKLQSAWNDELKMLELMETKRTDGQKVGEAFDFNKRLIDMDMIPDNIIEEIYESIVSYPEGSAYSEMRAMRFFGEMGFKNIGNMLSYKDVILSKVPEL